MKAALARLALVAGALVVGLWLVEKTLDVIGFEYRPINVEIGDGVKDARYYHSFADNAFVYDPRLIWRPRPAHGIFNRQGLRIDSGRLADELWSRHRGRPGPQIHPGLLDANSDEDKAYWKKYGAGRS